MSIFQKDFIVVDKQIMPSGSCLLSLSPKDGIPFECCRPGQFVQIYVNAKSVFLRRPISICNFENGKLELLIKPVGNGSRYLTSLIPGDELDIVGPLGRGFSIDSEFADKRILLVGGGVGAAPLSFLYSQLKHLGVDVTVLIGGRTAKDLECICTLYPQCDKIFFSTDDGSLGHKGFAHQHPVILQGFDKIYCCGPLPMMKEIAHLASKLNIWCEVSLENTMACGIGACLCCVQETSDSGNVCVCKEGPVFNINRLESWM